MGCCCWGPWEGKAGRETRIIAGVSDHVGLVSRVFAGPLPVIAIAGGGGVWVHESQDREARLTHRLIRSFH